MIDITRWRALIGASNPIKSVGLTSIDSEESNYWQWSIDNEINYDYHYSAIIWFVSTYYVLNIFFPYALYLVGT